MVVGRLLSNIGPRVWGLELLVTGTGLGAGSDWSCFVARRPSLRVAWHGGEDMTSKLSCVGRLGVRVSYYMYILDVHELCGLSHISTRRG